MSCRSALVAAAASSRAAASTASSSCCYGALRPATAAVPLANMQAAWRTRGVRSLHTTVARHAHRIVGIDYEEPKPQTPAVYSDRQLPNEFVKQIPENQLRRPDIAYGIGTPAKRLSQGVTPRRKLRPYGVQGIRTARRNEIEGPKELGHKMTQIFTGKVTSDKMQKTVAVEVAQYYKHPKYHKYIKTSRKFLTHDEEEECAIGDVVEIRMCRRFSKNKHFTLHKIIKPKLPFDEAAQRFMDHQPVWKQQAAIEEAQAATPIPSTQ